MYEYKLLILLANLHISIRFLANYLHYLQKYPSKFVYFLLYHYFCSWISIKSD